MNVRAQAVGMASQTQNVANAIVNQFFPIFLDVSAGQPPHRVLLTDPKQNCGFYAFYMFAGINFLLATFVYFRKLDRLHRTYAGHANSKKVIPETKQVMLEEMDTRFGGSNHVEKGGDLLGVEDAHHADLDTPLPNYSNKGPQSEHTHEIRE